MSSILQEGGCSPLRVMTIKWFESTTTTKIKVMIDNIMNNTYGVLTNRVSVEDILEMYEGKDAMFYGNPYQMTLEDIDEVISYFENTEEYEKCSELVEYKNILDLDIFLEKLRIKNGQTNYWI